jgi:hypothetical protein
VARTPGQTDDDRRVIDARDVQGADADRTGDVVSAGVQDRLAQAGPHAHGDHTRRQTPSGRLRVVVPTRSYLDVSG